MAKIILSPETGTPLGLCDNCKEFLELFPFLNKHLCESCLDYFDRVQRAEQNGYDLDVDSDFSMLECD